MRKGCGTTKILSILPLTEAMLVNSHSLSPGITYLVLYRLHNHGCRQTGWPYQSGRLTLNAYFNNIFWYEDRSTCSITPVR